MTRRLVSQTANLLAQQLHTHNEALRKAHAAKRCTSECLLCIADQNFEQLAGLLNMKIHERDHSN